MVFKDNQTLTDLYSNITKKVEPSKDQLVRQAPVLSNTALSKDQDMLLEAYKTMTKKTAKSGCDCKCCEKGCNCKDCKECNHSQKTIEEAKKKNKPDYMDVDKDGDKKESMKKAVKDSTKKESLSFKDVYRDIISEEGPHSNIFETDKKIWSMRRQINPEAQYFVHYKDGRKSKPLKGESVLMTLKADIHDIESVEPVHKQ